MANIKTRHFDNILVVQILGIEETDLDVYRASFVSIFTIMIQAIRPLFTAVKQGRKIEQESGTVRHNLWRCRAHALLGTVAQLFNPASLHTVRL